MREPVPTAPKSEPMSLGQAFQALVRALVKHSQGMATPRALWLLGGPPPPDAAKIGRKYLGRLNTALGKHNLMVTYSNGAFAVYGVRP